MEGLIALAVFFFQAEDGIRDVERSRGLGDVYKRQIQNIAGIPFSFIVVRFSHDCLSGNR